MGGVEVAFIPPEPIRRLRDLTRQRTLLVSERSREIQRLEKLLESTGIKYTSVTAPAHHAQLVRLALDRIDTLEAHTATISGMIDTLIRRNNLVWARDLLITMPGVSATGAENILADTDADMAAFATPAHLASGGWGVSGTARIRGTFRL